jgi:hypothetical protein
MALFISVAGAIILALVRENFGLLSGADGVFFDSDLEEAGLFFRFDLRARSAFHPTSR